MNTFSFILKRILPAAFALAVITVIVVLSAEPKPQAVAEDPRLVIEPITDNNDKNEIYSISETLGTKQLTRIGDAKILFDEKDNFVIFGKGWGNEIEDSESIGGTEFWLLNRTTNQETKLMNGYEGRQAFFGENGKIYYATRNGELFITDYSGKTAKKIQDHLLSPAISNDRKYIVYEKLPQEWTGGPYAEGMLGLTVLNTTTLQEKRITDKTDDWGPFFAPDNKTVIFGGANEFGMGSIFSVKIDGTQRTQLTNHGKKTWSEDVTPMYGEKPVFSADRKLMALESDRDIWVFEFNDSFTQVLKAKKVDTGKMNPKFSEDGKFLTVVAAPETDPSRRVSKIDLTDKTVW